ncbi:hypothetical protein [Sphingosinicella terrae]|nr:hypothetical protein [Sphingosinicella terrae]
MQRSDQLYRELPFSHAADPVRETAASEMVVAAITFRTTVGG